MPTLRQADAMPTTFVRRQIVTFPLQQRSTSWSSTIKNGTLTNLEAAQYFRGTPTTRQIWPGAPRDNCRHLSFKIFCSTVLLCAVSAVVATDFYEIVVVLQWIHVTDCSGDSHKSRCFFSLHVPYPLPPPPLFCQSLSSKVFNSIWPNEMQSSSLILLLDTGFCTHFFLFSNLS